MVFCFIRKRRFYQVRAISFLCSNEYQGTKNILHTEVKHSVFPHPESRVKRNFDIFLEGKIFFRLWEEHNNANYFLCFLVNCIPMFPYICQFQLFLHDFMQNNEIFPALCNFSCTIFYKKCKLFLVSPSFRIKKFQTIFLGGRMFEPGREYLRKKEILIDPVEEGAGGQV